MFKYKRNLLIGDEAIAERTAQRYKVPRYDAHHTTEEQHFNDKNQQQESTICGSQKPTFYEKDTNLNAENLSDCDWPDNHAHVFNEEFHDLRNEDLRKNKNHETLQDFINDKMFLEPISTTVDKSRGELLMMILKYSILNCLSVTALTNLLKLINTIFKTPVLPDSQYVVDKLLNPKNGIQFHAVCENCSAYLGEFEEAKSVKNCSICEIPVDLTKPSDTSFFVLMDPSIQISDLLSTYENYYSYVLKERVHKIDHIEDVYDGKAYRKFVNSLPEQQKYNYVTAVLNTDGAPKFKSSKYSIWPLFLKINELPPQDRKNKLVTCGLWFNKKKPEMSIFLDKFIDLINNLNEEGINCNIQGKQQFVNLHVVSCCVDSVARAPMQGIKQFNGKFGCNWCLHEGKFAEGSMKYPLMREFPKARDHEETVQLMLQISPDNPIFGIKYPTPLINLPYFNIISGFVPDYLHCCLEGVANQFTSYYLQSLSDEQFEMLDNEMNKIAAPNQIARLCRPLSCRNDWKGREWENFILYYSVPILSLILPKEKLNHWLLFVESLYILLKDSIHIEQLNKADEMLHKFVIKVDKLYGIKAMTFNVHQLLHICESVLNWGPLWTNSTFDFETANYYLLRAIKCSQGVTQQIVRFVNINHSLLIIEEHIKHKTSHEVMVFYYNTLHSKIQNVHKKGKILYFGRGSAVDPIILNMLQLEEDFTKCYFKMIKDNCLYESCLKPKRRSNNTFALLDDNKTYVRINYFIVNDEEEKEITICNIVQTRNCFSSSYKVLQIVENIEKEIIAVPTKKINRICTCVNVSNLMYLCPLPNLLHY